MVLFFLWIIALGLWHPRTGADVLQWRPTRSADLEAQNEIDDVAQMVAAQNALRERHGKALRTHEEVEARVRRDQQAMAAYADAYWESERDRRVAQAGGDLGLVVYEEPTCSKCQRLARGLTQRGLGLAGHDSPVAPPPARPGPGLP